MTGNGSRAMKSQRGMSLAEAVMALAIIGVTIGFSLKLVSTSKSHGSRPACFSTASVAMAWIVRDLGPWNVQEPIKRSIS